MPDILKLIDAAERLSFSQNLSIARPAYPGDRLMPDQKTENLFAEYLRLANGANVPVMATVHAFDTEAEIGSRPTAEKVTVEKLLIKRKINQTERLRLMLNHGVYSDDAITRYIFDDMRLMADGVKVRTEVAKMEVLSTGKMTVNENNLNFDINYDVPADNTKYEIDLNADADIIGQVQDIVDAAVQKGYAISEIITSNKVMRKIAANKGVQTLVYGSLGQGTFVSTERLQQLFGEIFGIGQITRNDLTYKYQKKDGTYTVQRFWAEDVLSFIGVPQIGVGLWGVTPEEEEYGPFTEMSAQQFITITQWATPDPVAVWTKASGVFIPVLPDPGGLFIAKAKSGTLSAVGYSTDSGMQIPVSDTSTTSTGKTTKS